MIPDHGNLQPGEEYFFARNIGLLNTYGIETGIFAQHSLGLNWHLDWNLTWQILFSSSDSIIVSKYLASHSNNLVQFNLGARSGGFSLRINGMYKDRDPAIAEQINARLESSYFLLNLKIDQSIFENRLELGFQVNNLFDRDYSDILGAIMPGRWIAAGITWNFSREFN
jgi:iron complex outermembrane receptor protein